MILSSCPPMTSADSRLKGHRIRIKDVVDYYLEGYTLSEIVANINFFDWTGAPRAAI